MKYSIDTSAILDGWVRYYPPDAFPGLWDRLEQLIAGGALRAIEEVVDELSRRDDDVYAWATAQDAFSVRIDDPVQDDVLGILEEHPKLIDTRKGRSGADPFVIALARVEDCIVVTGEGATGSLVRPNIPDVCDVLGVPCMGLVDLILEEGWAFG